MSDAESLVRRHDEAWNSQDVGALAELYTEDVVFQNHTAGEEPVEGRDAVLAHIAAIFERWPDMRFTSRRLYLADGFCTSEWTGSSWREARSWCSPSS